MTVINSTCMFYFLISVTSISVCNVYFHVLGMERFLFKMYFCSCSTCVSLTCVQREVFALRRAGGSGGRGDRRGHSRPQRPHDWTGGGGDHGCRAGRLPSLPQQMLDGVQLETRVREQDGRSPRDPERKEEDKRSDTSEEDYLVFYIHGVTV